MLKMIIWNPNVLKLYQSDSQTVLTEGVTPRTPSPPMPSGILRFQPPGVWRSLREPVFSDTMALQSTGKHHHKYHIELNTTLGKSAAFLEAIPHICTTRSYVRGVPIDTVNSRTSEEFNREHL
jgi:hypothetical protein